MPDNKICRIPVNATMQIINGEAVMIDAEYADIPADKIAEFLIKSFGVDAIFGGEENVSK
ncbi:MAG: hypothetical protein NC247_10000 [Ruminococcus flavefaciens]|nr:hypothetical protein [Ruminococcus flavefaciens]MCM1363187.1 hypothetical protein [Clostridiales bacterium]